MTDKEMEVMARNQKVILGGMLASLGIVLELEHFGGDEGEELPEPDREEEDNEAVHERMSTE